MNDIAKVERIAAVARSFTPGTPVGRLETLAGRMNQLTDIVSAVSMSGQHVGLYGERGVGKTSLANVLAEVFDNPQLRAKFQPVRVNCSTDDTYTTLWENVFAELGVADEPPVAWSPETVRRRLQGIDPAALIVLDELDRLEDKSTRPSSALWCRLRYPACR
jgi:Cdc6-like AAA superfamily ATPase